MKRSRSRSPYVISAGLFAGIGLGGMLFLDWGEVRLAFLLLIYAVLIIGIRLDDISCQLGSIDQRLAKYLDRPPAAGSGSGCPASAIDPLSRAESPPG